MTLIEFAKQQRLKITHDSEDGTVIIRGRRGLSHVYEYGEGLLGVMVMPETGTSHWWTAATKAFQAAGMKIIQNGDCEGAATFCPENQEQVRLAL
jgi:hypothetical protein